MRTREMNQYIRQSTFLVLLTLFYACSTPKDIAYFQDAEALNGMALQTEQPFRLRPEDKINIVVNSSNPMLEQQFALTTTTKSGNVFGADVTPVTSAGSSGNSQALAYTVDEQGTIDFPVLGKIRVAGMTRGEVSSYIKERLIARELVSDPIVTVEYVNLSVRVLGEVAAPGNIPITKDHFTILDAIAQAGDLTINGNRRTVLVNRQVDGVNQVYYVDLTHMQQTLLSPAYYLEQNDLVYVSPNDKRKRESRGEGNAFQTPSLWLSIASFLTTLAVLIF
ncbi:MAG: polysaccharide biosynthesis/export family protein [Parabacteroides sp.]